MLIRFTVENFLSFNEKTEFNMLTSPDNYRRHKHHVYEAGGVKVLRAAAIYGANGSGKSNLVKAMAMYCYLLKGQYGNRAFTFHHPVYFGLKKLKQIDPQVLTAEFFFNGKFMEFGIEILDNIITKEWLQINTVKDNEKPIFVYQRTTGLDMKIKLEVLNEAGFSREKEQFVSVINGLGTHTDKLIIHLLTGKGIPEIDDFYEKSKGFYPFIYSMSDFFHEGRFVYFANDDKDFKKTINDKIKSVDIGIEKVDIRELTLSQYLGKNEIEREKSIEAELKAGAKFVDLSTSYSWAIALPDKEGGKPLVKLLCFFQKGAEDSSEVFFSGNQSDGTLYYLGLLMALEFAKQEGSIIVLDEIEKSIHPLLLKETIKQFMDDKEAKGQLIFTTHDTNLLDLDIFRQDEIWFTEKRSDGSTEIYSLSDYSPRHDLDVRKGYLNGRFGGIPFLGNFEMLRPENKVDEAEITKA